MKKFLVLIVFSFIFLLSSCASISDWFSNKTDDSSPKAPETAEQNVVESKDAVKEENSNELSPLPEASDLLENKNNEKDSLKDLINTIPLDFEEPLVRDLELTFIPEDINETVLPSEDIIPLKTVESDNKKSESKTAEITEKQTVPVEKNIPATADTSSKTEKVTPVTQVLSEKNTGTATSKPAATQVQNKPVQTSKTSKPEEKNKTAAPVTESASQNKPAATEKTESAVDTKENNSSKKTEQNNVQKTETKTEPTVIDKNQDKTSETTKSVDTTKTTEAPVTSAGTKTLNQSPVLPSKPVAKTEDVKQDKSDKQQSTPVESKKEESQTISQEEQSQEQIINNSDASQIQPSRKAILNKGETLIVEYPGSGWLYLGSDHEYNNLESKGRKAGNNKTTYILSAKEAGTQIQHFYKTDSISGNYIDDYIEVTVRDQKGSPSTEIYAPAYEEIVPKKAEKPAISSTKIAKPDITIPAEAPKNEVPDKPKTGERTSIEYTPEDPEYKPAEEYTEKYSEPVTKATEPENTKSLLEQAQALYKEKKYQDALNVINTFLDYAINNRDTGLYLKGQILESDSSVKNIKSSIAAYNELINNYPASEWWDSANKRIIYLKRFYLEAR